MRYALLFLLAALLPAATIEVGSFEGRHAWILTNGDLRVSILRGGGHIAEVRLISQDPKTAEWFAQVSQRPSMVAARLKDG